MKNLFIAVVLILVGAASTAARAAETKTAPRFENTVTNVPAGGRITPTLRALPAPKKVVAEQPSLSISNSPAGPDLGIGASSPVPQAIRLLEDGAVADYGLVKVLFPADLT